MKKASFAGLVTALLVLLSACGGKNGECRIHGTAPKKLENVRIFLVPLKDQSKEAVDSIEIKNGRFEFVTTKRVVADIRLDYHYRDGIQNLLVVTEPGDIYVTIDSVSSSKGTPQNDSLQWWKDLTISHNQQYFTMMTAARQALQAGDSVSGNTIRQVADSLHRQYVRRTVKMAEQLEEGPLKEFFTERYPKTYKKKMPDGSVQEVKASWVED